MFQGIRFAILVTSDRASRGEYPDRTIPLLSRFITENGGACVKTQVIPDEFERIRNLLLAWTEERLAEVILTSGGTGLSKKDVTVDATLAVIEREVPGFGEEMRRRSLEITPFALLSRATAGLLDRTLILNLPGTPQGAQECLTFVQTAIPHVVKILHQEQLNCAAEREKLKG